MNNSIHPTQSNTREGFFPVLSGEDLTGKEGLLAVLGHDTGVAEVNLPDALTDDADLVILEGAAAGKDSTVEPLRRSRNARVRLSGTCNPGDRLCLAPVGGADQGKVRTVPAVDGTYRVFLRAEEKGVDGQLVLVRPLLAAADVVVST